MAVCWTVPVCNLSKKKITKFFSLKIIDLTFYFPDKHKDLYCKNGSEIFC